MGKRNRGGVEHREADSHLADVVSAFKDAMDRRNFVRSAGGILVASGIGCFADRTGVSAGFIEVTVTGLTPGAPNAGVVTVTPAGGGSSTPFTIPAAGVGKTEVIAGTYNVSYTAPQDHVLAPGSVVPATVTVVAGETTTFTLALTVALQIGTLQVTVTGLAGGATSGGTAVVTPSSGGAPVTIDIGPSGIAAAQFATGSYSVSYTPPAGYTLTSGTTPQTVTVTLNQTTTLPFGVTIIPTAVGTLQINVTGIGAGAANGGTAVATPSAGGSPTTLVVAVNGTISGTLAPGSYSVAYTAPTGHVITSGTTPQTVTITANTTTTITFVLTAFPPPDILADASFETDFDGFKNFGGGEPSNGVTRAQDFARTGLFSARFSWTPSGADIGSEMAFSFAGQDRIWVRFYFRLTSNVSTIWKFCRNRQTGFGTLFGGLFVEDNNKIISWGFDAELSAQTVGIGLTKAQVLDGNWHSIEYDYWRNGDPSGFPSVAFWFDGNSVAGSSAPSPGSWQNGRLIAGSRGSSIRIGLIQMMSTLNGGNSTSGQCNIDDVAISSLGRIGA